jgi:actin related protein 2/3 complex subunit 1A/1B
MLAEYDSANGWVNHVAWSPSGNQLAFVAHDSTVNVVDLSGGSESAFISKIKLADLPLRQCLFLSENALVGAGHDYSPFLFKNEGGNWKFDKKIDGGGAARAAGGGGAKRGGASSAMSLWKAKDSYGADMNETKVNTKHQNAITYLGIVAEGGGKVSKFSTTGLDGKLIVWDAASLGI